MPTDDELPPPEQTYEEWESGYDPDEFAHDRQTMATDVVTFTVKDGALSVLLVRRTEWPARGSWVLPGGFVRAGDRFDDTARRVVANKAHLPGRRGLIRLTFFDHPGRDSRTRVGSLAYLCLCGPKDATDAALHRYVTLGTIDGNKVQLGGDLLELGFDHDEIVSYAVDEARRRLLADPLWIVPALSDDRTFTIAQLNEARHTLGVGMTEDALRRRIGADDRVQKDGWVDTGSGKPSRVYRLSA